MKSFKYPQCNNAFVLTTKKEYKLHPDDNSAKSKYVSLVGDTYIAIENIEEALTDLDELQKLKVSIENEDTSFANTILGTSNYGNNNSCYRSYLTIDGKNVIEIRIANHYETKKTAIEKSNNLSQFIYQVVLITDPPQPQQNDSITTTTSAANLKILTKGIISKDTSKEELSSLLKSIHDYLISPNSEWEEIKTNNNQLNCNLNMNKKQIRLTESDLKEIVKESVKRMLKEGAYAAFSELIPYTHKTINDLIMMWEKTRVGDGRIVPEQRQMLNALHDIKELIERINNSAVNDGDEDKNPYRL